VTGRRPNVVVFVLDSVRADRTSLAGEGRDTTPNLDRIAHEPDGQAFPTAIAHARYTLPSSASILTGQYPGDHGLGFGNSSLDESVPTVAEAFSDAGYRTALVSNNHFVGPETGLDRGFDTTTVLPKDPKGIVETVGIGPVAKWGINIRRHSAGFEPDKYCHSGAYLTTSLVRQQLDELASRSESFFLCVHYNQTHRPYYPPLTWFDRYGDRFEMSRSEAGDFSMDIHENTVEKVAKGCPFTDDEWATLNALYDAQIEYTDGFIGSLFDRITEQFGDTVVVATGDHGEHLGERGALGHKYALDDALLRVPLVTAGLKVPTRASPVQHTDVMRTLLAAAGADASFVDGIDLRSETRRFAVSQDTARSLDPIYEVNPEFDASQFYPGAERSLPERTAVRTDTHRYVRGEDGSQVLYRMPDESTEVSAEEPEVAASLNETVDEWLDDHCLVDADGGRHGGDELSADTKSRLMKMGYLEEDL